MKAKIFSLMALVLCLVSCQTEPEGFDVIVDGEVDTVITVTIPEAETRAGSSSLGVFNNGILDDENVTMRYILEIYYGDESRDRLVDYSDGTEVAFPVRLVPDRHYNFVVWADVVTKEATATEFTDDDNHYNTENLEAITLNGEWDAMDETRDAFTGYFNTATDGNKTPYNGSKAINIPLTRPFAKLRVITTDFDELAKYGIVAKSGQVSYSSEYRGRASFNAYNGEPSDAVTSFRGGAYDIVAYASENGGDEHTIFSDYIFASTNGDIVKFDLNIYEDEEGNNLIKANHFNTDIRVKRNYITTIRGDVLTDGNNIKVEVSDDFENGQYPNDPPYYQEAVTNGVELIKALLAGQEIIVLNNITVTAADFAEATRNGAAINPVLNLNGFTITIENNGTEALVNLNGGALTVEGEGAIKSDNGALVETIYNAGEATIEEKAATEPVVNCLSDIRAAFANGGVYNMVCDVVYPETLVLEAGKSLVLNLNGKTLSQSKKCTGNYNMIYNKGNLTINGDGAISFKDTGAGDPNFGWGSYTLRNEGTLVVNGATIEHLGEQNPGNGQPNVHMYCAIFQYSGKSTINSGVISTPTYRSARLWNGEMTINGGQFVGQLWLQAVSDNANLVINGGEFVARGNDGSSVFVSNSGKAVKCSINGGFFYNKVGMSEPIACIAGGKFTPAAKEATSEELLVEGYEFVEENGVWVVNYVTTTTAELKAALAEGKDVVLSNDLTDVAVDTKAPYGNWYGIAHNGGVFNGGRYTLDFDKGPKNSKGKYDNYGIMTSGGTIKNVAISGVFRGIMIMYPTQDIYVDNVTLNDPDDYGVCYTINTGEGDGTHNLYVSNTTLNGWTSIGTAVKETYFTNCTFGQGLYYTDVYGRLVKTYVDTVFENCKFSSKYYIDLSAFVGTKVTLKNCTVNGVKITAENWTSLVAPEDTCGEGQISVELKNSTYLTANNVADYIIFE